MPTFLLHIQVRPECQERALRTLSAIQEEARRDRGCLGFTWTQHRSDPLRFTLFERWATRADLDAHLQRSPERWNEFVPCLAGDPRSEEVRPLEETALSREEVEGFVRDWFDRLNRHVALPDIEPMVSAGELEMAFPEATLRNRPDFEAWYDQVGRAYRDQDHVLERLDVSAAGETADVDLTVVWRAVSATDGSRVGGRADQSWRLRRSEATGRPEIVDYRVRTFQPVG